MWKRVLFCCWFVSSIFTYFLFNLCSIIFLDQKITSIVIIFFNYLVMDIAFQELLELCINKLTSVIVVVVVWLEGAVQAPVSRLGLCKLRIRQVTYGKVLLFFHVLLPFLFERFLILGISGVILLDLVSDHGGRGGIAGLTFDYLRSEFSSFLNFRN